MRVTLAATAALLLAGCSALQPGSVATPAEQQRYLQLVHQGENELVQSLTDADLVELGLQVCDAAQYGTINDATVVVAESLAQSVYDSTPEKLIGGYISTAVISSLTGLCPEYAYKLGG